MLYDALNVSKPRLLMKNYEPSIKIPPVDYSLKRRIDGPSIVPLTR